MAKAKTKAKAKAKTKRKPTKSRKGVGGAKSKYDPKIHIPLAIKFALIGLTDKEMSSAFKVSEATFYNWKKKYLEFLDAVEHGKYEIDADVAAVAKKRALGYEFTEIKREITTKDIPNNDGSVRRVEIELNRTETVKHYQPSDSAIQFWLTNRRGGQWKRNPEAVDDEPPLPSKVTIGTVDARIRPPEEAEQE